VVTIRDVARHAGVSPATVSRVVNGLVCYSDETRERVENAVKSLSYETDYLARGLKTRQTSVIGLLAPMVSDALASQGVEEEVQERGYAAMLGRTGAKPAFIAGYLRTLRTYRAAGVILISAVITPETRQLLGPNIPIISVAIGDKSGSPSVAIDDEQAAYDATSHLLRLGHRRIGLLTGDPASVHVAQPRERGYLRAMTEAGCTPVTATGSFFYESGAAGVDELLQQEPGLTAIFAMSDEMSAAVVNELQRRGHRVPEDVSVLGFDNTSTARHVNPPLSTTAQPLEEMGRMAVKKLLRSRDLAPKTAARQDRSGTAPAPSLSSPVRGQRRPRSFLSGCQRFGTRHSFKCCGHIGLLPVRLTARRVEPDRRLFPQSRPDRCRCQGNLRGRLPDHVERPGPVAERVEAGLAGRKGGGGGLAARLARKGGQRRHPVSPSASFYAPAVVLSPRGAGP
jgi:DNA-binding LacI/PurR family transcriptional regulator